MAHASKAGSIALWGMGGGAGGRVEGSGGHQWCAVLCVVVVGGVGVQGSGGHQRSAVGWGGKGEGLGGHQHSALERSGPGKVIRGHV